MQQIVALQHVFQKKNNKKLNFCSLAQLSQILYMHLLIKVDYFAVLLHVFTVVAFQNHPVLQWNGKTQALPSTMDEYEGCKGFVAGDAVETT